MGWPSFGLMMLYLPTVIELLLMSSDIHFVWPDCSSNRIDSDTENRAPRIKRRYVRDRIMAFNRGAEPMEKRREGEFRAGGEGERKDRDRSPSPAPSISDELTRRRQVSVGKLLMVCPPREVPNASWYGWVCFGSTPRPGKTMTWQEARYCLPISTWLFLVGQRSQHQSVLANISEGAFFFPVKLHKWSLHFAIFTFMLMALQLIQSNSFECKSIRFHEHFYRPVKERVRTHIHVSVEL